MSVSETQDGALRKVRSVGDLPLLPERAHVHSSLRPPDSSTSDFEAPRIRSTPSTPIVPSTTSSLLPLQLNPNVNPSPPTQAPAPAHQNPLPQPQNTALHVRVLAYFGLGRRATRARKALVSLIWNISWGFLQVCLRLVPSSINLKFEHIARSNCPYADSDCNSFQESL